MKKLIFSCLIVSILLLILGYHCGKNNADSRKWYSGYSYCMKQIIETLVLCDDVRIGNLIVNEPNTTISRNVFFVIDPNMAGIEGGMGSEGSKITENAFYNLSQPNIILPISDHSKVIIKENLFENP